MLRHYWLKFKRDCLALPIAYLAKYAIRIILKTCRIEISGLDTFVAHAAQDKCILALWHNQLAIVAEILNSHAPQFIYAAVISKSRDGEPLALLASSYKAGRAIRVPHDAKHHALKMVIDLLNTREQVVMITPDGPRGPACKAKPGIALMATASDATIVSFSWSSDNLWELKTWDRFKLPKPFSKILVRFGEPFKIDASHDLRAQLDTVDRAMQLSK